MALAGCDAGVNTRETGSEHSAERVLPAWYQGNARVLRVQADVARERLWVLTEDALELYDLSRRQRLAQVALQDWVWAHEPYACPPDLALDAKGAAIVSSNVVPVLWRIDPTLRRAQKIPLSAPLHGVCGITISRHAPDGRASRFLSFCAASEHGPWWVNLAPDQRFGYVSRVRCDASRRAASSDG